MLGQEGMHGSVVCILEVLAHCSGQRITLPDQKERSVQDDVSLVKGKLDPTDY